MAGVKVLPIPTGSILDNFLFFKEQLGRGQYGIVSTCIHKCTGVVLACKTISKAKLKVSFY